MTNPKRRGLPQSRTNPVPNCPQTARKGEGAGTLRANLTTAIAAADERLPGSPGEAYLAGRGIPLDVAQALRIGWATASTLAGRVVFPLCDPDGLATSATGRATNDSTTPKYKALAGRDGYVKTLFNGEVIAQARRSGHPVVVVEGPLDAAACVAAGIPLTVALCGKAYAHPDHFAGVATVILALDADNAGQEGRRQLWLDLTAHGIDVLVLPASALAGAKDLGEYWQEHHAIPVQLAACVTGPHMQCAPATPMQAGNPHASPGEALWATMPILKEVHQRTAEAQRYAAMTLDDLPADVKAEAEELAVELGADVEALGAFWADVQRRHSPERGVAGQWA